MRTYAPEIAEYYLDTPKHKSGKGVLIQRTRTVKAGDHLDADIYPVLDWQYSREVKARRKTPEAMQRANIAHARRQLEQLMNANFGEGDLLGHFTMAAACSEQDMQKITRNFVARLRKAYRKAGGELRYIYVIESTGSGEKQKWHIHMALNGGVLSRDEVEKIWRGGLSRVDRVQEQENGLAGFANYITQRKETQEKLLRRKWACSKGLKRPRATYSDSRFSRAAAARIEKAVREDARREFEKRYPGYRLTEYSVHYSDFLPGVYIHAHMRRKD